MDFRGSNKLDQYQGIIICFTNMIFQLLLSNFLKNVEKT